MSFITHVYVRYLIVALVGVGAGVGALYFSGISFNEEKEEKKTPESASEVSGSIASELPITLREERLLPKEVEQVEVEWLLVAERLPDMHIATSVASGENYPTIYRKVGTTKRGEDVVTVEVACEAFCDYAPPYFVIVREDGGYEVLLQHLGSGYDLSRIEDYLGEHPFGAKWDTKVIFDKTRAIADLLAPTITLTKGAATNTLRVHGGARYIDDDTQAKLVPAGVVEGLYRAQVGARAPFETYPSMRLERLYKQMPAGMYAEYMLVPDFYPEMGEPPKVVWSDGVVNTARYRNDGAGGCGGMGAVAVDSRGVVEGVAAGTTQSGEHVYVLGETHPLSQEFYKASGGKRYVWDKEKQENAELAFTLANFVRERGAVHYTDMLGRTIVYSNTEYGPQAECGKPVIYLYPEQDMDVRVEVGADVRVSVPDYGAGWDVHAKTNGTVVHKGATYPYLFWEGAGHGEYPDITQGVIVGRERVGAVLREHLARLGLVGREVEDFMEFWMPHMPAKKYVRLSWLGTKEMDELAPLHIVPKPDTSLRVFLDFEGVDVPYALKPQKLRAVERRGFTVVEWGGLLR